MLRPRTGAIVEKKIVVYDLEWYPGTYQLRLAGLYDGETYQSFTTIGELLDAILVNQYRGAYVYAHAGGLADAQFLLREIVHGRRELTIDGSFSGSSAVMLNIVDADKHKWTLVDSLWTFRSSLKKIGESIGLKKMGDWTCPGSSLVQRGTIPIAYSDVVSIGTGGGSGVFGLNRPYLYDTRTDAERDDPEGPQIRTCGHREGHCIFYAPMPVLREYNYRDCEVLWLALSRLQDMLRSLGGELGPTAASCALRLFQRRFLKSDIPTDKGVNTRAREAYNASRVEVFRKYAGPGVTFFDVCSSFPWSMTQSFPGRTIGRERRWHEDDDLALVRAKVTVPPMYVPPLAYRAPDHHLYHPTGTWEATFTGVDLQALLETGGRIEKVKWCRRFEPRTDLRDYVLTIYDMRKNETDEFLRDNYKLLLNSLYGKFGEREEKQRLLVRPSPDALERAAKGQVKRVMPGVYLTDEVKRVPHMHVPASAVITARSRQLLGRRMREATSAKREDRDGPARAAGKLWYGDTDCLATDVGMPTGNELGELKVEKTVIEDAVFLRAKLYRVDRLVKAKGFPRLTRRQFDTLAAGNPVEFTRMLRLREKLGMGQLDPTDEVVSKKLNGDTRAKRCFDTDGNSFPWEWKQLQKGA